MPQRPFHNLSDRLAGRPADKTLYEGVPEWLGGPLKSWIWSVTQQRPDVATNALLELRWEADFFTDRRATRTLCSAEGEELLMAVDAVLQVHPLWDMLDEQGNFLGAYNFTGEGEAAVEQIISLHNLLTRGGSYLQVSLEAQHLVRRVDEGAQRAYDKAIEDAPARAAKHLREAWDAAYRREPDPTASYNASVKAVEAVLNPLVVPKANKPTIGMALNTLKDQGRAGKWQLAIGNSEDQAANIERFAAMADLFLANQDSRHGGGPRERDQEQKEAEAVLHLAVLIVQWVNAAVLKGLG
ncbi:hypothetical protein ACWFMI_27140 [Nocardiopsis terrae]